MRVKSLVLCFLLFVPGNSKALEKNDVIAIAITIGAAIGTTIGICTFLEYKGITLYRMALSACAKNNFTLLRILKFLGVKIDTPYSLKDRMGIVFQEIEGKKYCFPLLQSAAENKNEELFQFLLSLGYKPSSAMVYDACKEDNTDLVKKYINAGWNSKGKLDKQMIYCRYNNPNIIHCACKNGNKKIIELLLDAGVDINQPDRYGNKDTPLTYAFQSFKGLAIVDWLLSKGATSASGINAFSNMLKTILYTLEGNEKDIQEQDQSELLQALSKVVGLLNNKTIVINIENFNMFTVEERQKVRSWVGKLFEDGELELYNLLCGISLIQNINEKQNLFLSLSLVCKKQCLQFAVAKNDIKLLELICNDKQVLKKMCSESFELGNVDMAMHFFGQNFESLKGNNILHVAASISIDLLNDLVRQCDQSKEILSKKNNENKTAFYVGHEKKVIQDINADFLQYCDDKIEFLQQELYRAASVFDCNNIDEFIQFCVDNGSDLNRRNKKGKRPVDKAVRNYQYATKILAYDSPSFIIKEKIMHAFLLKTSHLKDQELVIMLKLKRLPNDVIKSILNYHYSNNVDRLVANEIMGKLDSFYYQKTKQEKEVFKHNIVKVANTRLNKLLSRQNFLSISN